LALPRLSPKEFVLTKCGNAPGQPARFKGVAVFKTLTVFGSRPGIRSFDRILLVYIERSTSEAHPAMPTLAESAKTELSGRTSYAWRPSGARGI